MAEGERKTISVSELRLLAEREGEAATRPTDDEIRDIAAAVIYVMRGLRARDRTRVLNRVRRMLS